MTIPIICPSCDNRFGSPESLALVMCPKCGKMVTVHDKAGSMAERWRYTRAGKQCGQFLRLN